MNMQTLCVSAQIGEGALNLPFMSSDFLYSLSDSTKFHPVSYISVSGCFAAFYALMCLCVFGGGVCRTENELLELGELLRSPWLLLTFT